jgi:hypothetical protein
MSDILGSFVTTSVSAINNIGVADTAAIQSTIPGPYSFASFLLDASDCVDVLAPDVITLYVELAGLGDVLASSSNTTSSLTDSANLRDIIQAAVQNLIAETANGADVFAVESAAVLADIADALGTFSGSYTGVMLVAEMVAALEMYNGADGYDVTESGNAADVYAARVAAIAEIIEERYIDDVPDVLVHVMQVVTDTADGATDITSTGSLLNALLADTAVATIRLNIGGELFTGWVLNTDTLAPSEYQFADRQFNSACKHGSKYLMAAEDGIYEFTESTGVESVMTYIKTGKTDFGSDLKKRIVNSYIVYSASGNMVLKVTTSEYGQLQTRNYRMVPPGNSETTDVRRFDLGRGIKSRYWQFELVGDGVDCDIDEIGMLPIVLSRRI